MTLKETFPTKKDATG